MITGWTLLFVVIGVGYCSAQLMRLIEWLDKPIGRKGRWAK